MLKPCVEAAALCWIEAHPGLAGYIQAVGSILAILVALGLARSSAIRETAAAAAAAERERQAEANSARRAAEADRLADERIERGQRAALAAERRATDERFNGLLDRIAANGAVVKADADRRVGEAEIEYLGRPGIITGAMQIAQIDGFKAQLATARAETGEPELVEAIERVQNAIRFAALSVPAPMFVQGLRQQALELTAALQQVASLRRVTT